MPTKMVRVFSSVDAFCIYLGLIQVLALKSLVD